MSEEKREARAEDAFIRLVLQNRLVTREQVDRCLEIQTFLRSVGIEKNLAEILCARRCLASSEVDVVSRLQKSTTFAAATAPDTLPEKDIGKIGAIVVGNRLLTRAQLDECLRTQKAVASVGIKMKIGEIMSHKGYLDQSVLDSALAIQRAQRKRRASVRTPIGAFVFGLAFGGMILVLFSPGTLTGDGSGAPKPTEAERSGQRSGPDSWVSRSAPPAAPAPEAEAGDPPRGLGGSSAPEPAEDTHPKGRSPAIEEMERRREIERELFSDPPELPGERELFPERFRPR